MGKITGFLEIKRETPARRPVAERIHDWQEVYLPFESEKLQKQGARSPAASWPSRERAAWSAASPFATTAAPSTT